MKYQLFTQANAQEVASTTAAPNEFSMTSLVPLALIFTVFYFLIIRPQSKKMKEHQAMLNTLKIGDKVVTSGGIVGTVADVLEKESALEIKISDSVNIKVLRNYVVELVKKEEIIKKK